MWPVKTRDISLFVPYWINLVSIPRYYILVSYWRQNCGIEPTVPIVHPYTHNQFFMPPIKVWNIHTAVWPTLLAFCSVLTWAGESKLTPPSLEVWWSGIVSVAGSGLAAAGREAGARPGITLTAPGIRGTAPGRRLAGLTAKLAWKKQGKFFLICDKTNEYTQCPLLICQDQRGTGLYYFRSTLDLHFLKHIEVLARQQQNSVKKSTF